MFDRLAPTYGFEELKRKWLEDTFYSSYKSIIENDWYTSIIALGDRMVPLILKDIAVNGTPFWHDALVQITGENPISDDMHDLIKINLCWILWGREKGIVY